MNPQLESVAPGLLAHGEPSVLCVHFAADGREHSMWYLDAEDARRPVRSGFTANLSTEWSLSSGGVARAVVRRGRHVLCEGLLLRSGDGDLSAATGGQGGTLGGTFGSLFGSDPRRKDNGLLRAEGVSSYPATMISNIRHRPLLATFARGMDLPAPLARHVHALLLHTGPAEPQPPCRACHGTGYVRGEPCLACS